MVRKILTLLIVILLYCYIAEGAWAFNNKVGIHILETAEAEQASKLVNSSGGDWGYVTIVLRDDDMDKEKWQRFMDDCRRLHLIPIVRLGTHTTSAGWAKPESLSKWPDFLNSLNWPVKEQWVVLFNEPNHALEWAGEINPSEYTKIADELISLFRSKNANFRLMVAGLDQAADGGNGTMTEDNFLAGMLAQVPDIFSKVNAWASHSYPNHGFVGRPEGIGKASIRGYEWELNKIGKDLPIYITETGWPASWEGGSYYGYYNEETVADFTRQAFKIWFADERVKAVTPFVLNYPASPFEPFSWLKSDGKSSPKYEKVLGIDKIAGDPEQIESYEIVALKLAEILPVNYEAKGKVKIKNTGQWIMGEKKNYEFRIMNLELGDNNQSCEIVEEPKLDGLLEPGQEGELDFRLKTSTQSGECKLKLGSQERTIYTFKPFELRNKRVSLGQQIKARIRLWFMEWLEK